ncbi:MAG: DUF4339 domain-containing protein [Opitutales bacterium]
MVDWLLFYKRRLKYRAMQIFLHLNGENVGPFTLPRVSAKLVSGEAPPDTLAWREGLDDWYPLSHEHWAEVGISANVAPIPPVQSEPKPQVEEVSEPEETPESESVVGESELEEVSEQPSAEEPETDSEPESVPEDPGSAFAGYGEEDFKPPSLEDMDKEMTHLRAEREPLAALIGKRAFEAGIEDEGIEDAKAEVVTARQRQDETAIEQANAKLGQAVLAAGVHDDALEDLRDRDRELSDRMLNLQMQARRMGGVSRKKSRGWVKWIVILFALAVIGGAVAAATLLQK